MTFVEAAIVVLEREGKPLPTRRLAELAVKHNLLSVVGRDPEATMQARLDDAVAKGTHRQQLVQLSPGLFGLRSYPPREAALAELAPEPPRAESAVTPEPNGESTGEKKGRRRRRRGRGGKEASPAPGQSVRESEPQETEESESAPEEITAEAAKEADESAVSPSAGEPLPEGEKRSRRRSRRGGRGRRQGERAATATSEANAAAIESGAKEEPVSPPSGASFQAPAALEAGTVDEETQRAEPELAEDNEGEGFVEDFDLPSGPLLAPGSGAEEVTRGDEERVVRAEIQGRRPDDRGRRPRRGRGRRDERPARTGGNQERPQGPPPSPSAAQAKAPAPGPVSVARVPERGLVDAVLEVLRNSDGRPMHIRQITDMALKRRLVDSKAGAGDVSRRIRAALVSELRDREADGLRARIRGLGGGHFTLADRKLDQELVPLERELAERAARLREATRTAVRRRILRLPPPAFEALGRALLDRLGIVNVELVRQGEGVTYYGGSKTLGVASVKTLVAMRPGEAEISRRAVGELRAGLSAKGFDEGLLLAAGRASQEALAELKTGSGVVVHDGLSLAGLCVRHGLGVRRVHLPIDYLDLELFSELTEG